MKQLTCTLTAVLCLAHLFFAGGAAAATQKDIVGPAGSGQFGHRVTVLPNGNIVVTDPLYDASGPIADVGAVYLYSPAGELISTLTGSTAGDRVGQDDVIVLANGNYVVRSTRWKNGGVTDAGAATWCSGTQGCSGTVSAANSLVGSSTEDRIGLIVAPLPNGHYVARALNWDNGAIKDAGAVTWCNGTSGCTGAVSGANSLVGTTAGDEVGSGTLRVLANGNYVTGSRQWDNGAVPNAGAATWCDGTKGCVGPVSTANSLHGTTADDRVGVGAIALTNGNYVVQSPFWSNGATSGAGAATWCNGTTGCSGPVSIANSLVGRTKDDYVGVSGRALTNGNYVIASDAWDNGTIVNAGAVTWCNGATGCAGEVLPANSLVGSASSDVVGIHGVVPLANGNYVVNSPNWNNGATPAVGAATWCNGSAGCSGPVSPANSLVGSSANDGIGLGTTALTNGHYVVRSSEWNNGGATRVGIATWCNGTTGRTGVASAANSLVGSSKDDRIGDSVTALQNGNYVVASQDWADGTKVHVGAATWCNGTEGCIGTVSPANSLVGSSTGDLVGRSGVTPLANGNYLVRSALWSSSELGALTWCDGTAGCTGAVSSANSLVGTTAGDEVGSATGFADGNYLAATAYWNNGVVADVGAVTLGRGDSGTVGPINPDNSVLGKVPTGGTLLTAAYSLVTGQMVVGRPAENIISLFTYRGATLTVTTTDDHDDGACSADDCTLREAIIAANLAADDNTIDFLPGLSGIIQLGGALPSLTSNITLQGPGADVLTVRRNSVGLYRIFTITNGTANGPEVNISGLTISDGQATSLMFPFNSGGGILNDRGTVTVRNCTLTGNQADFSEANAGGGILNFEGRLTVEQSTLSRNIALHGGAIANVRRTSGNASLVLRDSTLDNNTALGGNGGGVYNEATSNGSTGSTTLLNCTLSGNSATTAGFLGGAGGAIFNAASTSGRAELFLQDCTLAGNSAPAGGGIYNNNFSAEAVVRLQNTILKKGANGSNFLNSSGTIRSLGNNLANDDAGSGTNGTEPGGFLNAPGDIRNTDPLLGSLADNQGPTLTHALLNGSPAINAGESSGAPDFDQRGFARVDKNDIGAFEFAATLPPPPTPTPNPTATPLPSATPGPSATPMPTATPEPSATPVPTPTPPVNRLANISTRVRVETGDNVLIGGFIVTGASQKTIIIRALGPSLPLAGALPNPVLELYDGNGQFVDSNDNWQEAPNAQQIIESTIAPPNEFESAILRDVAPGAYTAVVRDAADGVGTGLIEIYDLGSAQDSRLANISTRGRVLTGDSVMIGGLIVTGSSPQKVIIRAIGPSLPVDGKLEDPVLELFDGNGALLSSNDNWREAQQAELEATTIPPSNDLESAIVISVPPAAYTAIVRGAADTTGVALVEIYALD